MKRSEFDLRRLLHAAARAPEDPIPEVPLRLEWQVLQAWRRGLCLADDEMAWLGLFRRIFAFTCLVMLVSVLLSFSAFHSEPTYEMMIANSVMQMSFAP